MTFQESMFGEPKYVGNDTRNVRQIIEKFPAVDHPDIFFWTMMKHYCPALAQLPEHQQIELRAFCRDVERLRRRRQEYRAEHS